MAKRRKGRKKTTAKRKKTPKRKPSRRKKAKKKKKSTRTRKRSGTRNRRRRTGKRATKKRATKKRAAKKRPSTKQAPSKKKKKQKAAKPPPGLPLKEVRARLGLIQAQLAELPWLQGLYLYGSNVVEDPAALRRASFIVTQSGLRGSAAVREAGRELEELLGAVLPIQLDLQIVDTPAVGELLTEENPAAIALLGHAEAVFVR